MATLGQAIKLLQLADQKAGNLQPFFESGLLSDLFEAGRFIKRVNRHELRQFLGLEAMDLPITVDYEKPLPKLLAKIGNKLSLQEDEFLEWGSLNKETRNRQGKQSFYIRINPFSFNRSLGHEPYPTLLMEEDGHCPANIREIIELALQYPNIPQWQFWIVALGNRVKERRDKGNIYHPMVYKENGKFELNEAPEPRDLCRDNSHCRYASVPIE